MRVQVKLQDLLGTHLSLLYLSLAEPGALLQLYRWFSELTIISSPKKTPESGVCVVGGLLWLFQCPKTLFTSWKKTHSLELTNRHH